MKFRIATSVAAIAVALSAAAAFAQAPAKQPNDPSWTNEYNPSIKPPPAVWGNDSMGGAAAQKTPPGSQETVGGYNMGGAQSLEQLSAMGQYEETGGGAQKTSH